VHRAIYGPLYFGRQPRSRFAAPNEQFGILYVASDPHAAFIETFGQSTGQNIVSPAELAERAICRLTATRPLRFVDLTGAGLARIGADGRLCDGEHAVARGWVLACWSHSAQPDGLYYRARHDPSRFSAAIFDRAAGALETEDLGSLLDPRHTLLLADLLDTYGFGLHDAP
jgi:hypothetical protein